MSEPTTEAGRQAVTALGDSWVPLVRRIEAEARADALDVEALAEAYERTLRTTIFGIHQPPFWDTFAREYRAILAERQQDAATDEAETEWIKPLPKDVP